MLLDSPRSPPPANTAQPASQRQCAHGTSWATSREPLTEPVVLVAAGKGTSKRPSASRETARQRRPTRTEKPSAALGAEPMAPSTPRPTRGCTRSSGGGGGDGA